MRFEAMLALPLLLLLDAPVSARDVAIVGATVFDGTGAPPRAATVLVRDGRIVAVGPEVRPTPGAEVIEAQGEALLPGFFDLHTHWTPTGVPDTTPAIATAYVRAGVTTVNDFHEPPEAWAPRRAWLATLASPHVRFAARVGVPGGHGADWGDGRTTLTITTPEAARAAVAGLAPYRPDLIKAFTDGWRYGAAPDNNSMNENVVAALTEAAHGAGLRVNTHTVTVERGLQAARAKVDVLAHVLQDRDLAADEVAAIRASGMAMTPTLAVYDPDKPGRPSVGHQDPATERGRARFAHALHNVKALHDAGVTIALGTDAGMPGTPHGVSTLHEMELLVQAGLTPAEALIAGTSASARVSGLIDDRGTIEPGKRADLVLVAGRPWETIADVRRTDRVLIDGRLVSGPGAPPLPPGNALPSRPPTRAAALVDDFERADGRTALDTLRVDDPDGGLDRTQMWSGTIARDGGGHVLLVTARMAWKAGAWAGVALPLSRGSIVPVDARGFRGLRLAIRGEGSYRLQVNGVSGRWSVPVEAGARWRTVQVPFATLRASDSRSGPWRGDDLLQIELGGTRPPGAAMWLEADDVGFY